MGHLLSFPRYPTLIHCRSSHHLRPRPLHKLPERFGFAGKLDVLNIAAARIHTFAVSAPVPHHHKELKYSVARCTSLT